MDSSSNIDLVMERQKKVVEFIRRKADWIVYLLLALVVYIAVWIRTRNLAGLRDITTGGWSLGPDLDPYLFLRWAKYIVENGSLFAIDYMRYVPLGFSTSNEFPLLARAIAFFHSNIASIFGSNSVEQSAAIFPVFMFALVTIAFFLMTREIFMPLFGKKDAGYMAIASSFFLAVIPSFVPRTIAGIPEKESIAFFFFFMTFYLFLLALRQENMKKMLLFSAFAGVFARLMGLTWGGYVYIILILNASILTSFIFGQMNLKRTLSYLMFIFVADIIPSLFISKDAFIVHFSSIEGVSIIASVFVLIIDLAIHGKLNKFVPEKIKPYKRTTSIAISGIIILLGGLVALGPKIIISRLNTYYFQLVQPATSRLIQTVAENRQPFFVEWAPNFGPYIGKIPVLLPLVFIGSLILIIKGLKSTNISLRERGIIVTSWSVFVLTTVFTRYRAESVFNGSSFLSISLYFLGFISFLGSFFYVNNRESKKGNRDSFLNISFGIIFTIIFLIIGLISARAFIRLVIILVPIASVLIGYLLIVSINKVSQNIRENKTFDLSSVIYVAIILLIIFAAYNNYNSSKLMAQSYIPSGYNQQWQKAMFWVRENTTTNAVFGHWWDYGYWIQSIGERATVLDGANFIGYWNYLMGRHGLTETNFTKTLDFLYAHNVTHFLIDSTDIGKYGAFSTIGSDITYDRRSWIPTFLRDNSQTGERKNTTLFVYPGGTSLDRDITYNLNGTELFLPEGKAALAAVVVAVDNKNDSISEVYGVYYLQQKTYQIPLRYYWDQKTGLVDTKKGVSAGVFLFPRVSVNSQGGANVEPRGALIYLSPKTVMSNVARFYLYGEKNNNFKLVHSEDDSLVSILHSQNIDVGDFVYFNEFRGPIKIWELNYPKNMVLKEEYLETHYPEELLYA